MSGYYEMKGKLQCWEDWYNKVNEGTTDYVLDRKYWMRPNVNRCHETSLGTLCSFYGPKDTPRTTQESFLQGRGQAYNDQCPDCEVIYLPDEVFNLTKEKEKKKSCQDMSLQPQFTRQPKSCGTLAETETTAYAFMPGAYQKGYNGYNAVCSTNIQSREIGRMESRAGPRTPAERMMSYSSCKNA